MNENTSSKNPIRKFTIHLVSDATGTTLQGLSRACLSQFDDIQPKEKLHPMIRTEAQLNKVIQSIAEDPGPVVFTMVDRTMRKAIQRKCEELGVPGMPVLDPLIRTLSSHLGLPAKGIPGLQHALDESYFHRIAAVDFVLHYDDGRSLDGIEEADVILVGVSRTSKTPTCIFLARRGIRAANIPIVPGVPFPEKILNFEKDQGPMVVGLTESPDRLIQLRKNRLKAGDEQKPLYGNEYLDQDKVDDEIRDARRMFSRQEWPVIDVTRRSVEETAAEIMLLLNKRRSRLKKKNKGEGKNEGKNKDDK